MPLGFRKVGVIPWGHTATAVYELKFLRKLVWGVHNYMLSVCLSFKKVGNSPKRK